MKDWVRRLSFVAVWVVLVAAGLWFFRGVFVYACDDCIGGGPGPGGLGYYYGEGGFKVPWGDVVAWSVLTASFVTGLLVVVSRALRRRPGSVEGG